MMPLKPLAMSAKPSVAPTIECVPLTGSPKNVAMKSQPQQPISDDSWPTIRSASRGCAAQSRPMGSGDDEGHDDDDASHEELLPLPLLPLLLKSAASVELSSRLKEAVSGDEVLVKTVEVGFRWRSSLYSSSWMIFFLIVSDTLAPAEGAKGIHCKSFHQLSKSSLTLILL